MLQRANNPMGTRAHRECNSSPFLILIEADDEHPFLKFVEDLAQAVLRDF
jgi:hypothetical protein